MQSYAEIVGQIKQAVKIALSAPKGVETADDKIKRMEFLRKMGYKA